MSNPSGDAADAPAGDGVRGGATGDFQKPGTVGPSGEALPDDQPPIETAAEGSMDERTEK